MRGDVHDVGDVDGGDLAPVSEQLLVDPLFKLSGGLGGELGEFPHGGGLGGKIGVCQIGVTQDVTAVTADIESDAVPAMAMAADGLFLEFDVFWPDIVNRQVKHQSSHQSVFPS
jgi:hypothetical protein